MQASESSVPDCWCLGQSLGYEWGGVKALKTAVAKFCICLLTVQKTAINIDQQGI